jgi:hypothetical protein
MMAAAFSLAYHRSAMLRAPTAATRRLWEVATFGTPHPGRRLAGLAIVGAIAGFGEAAVVILVIALVSGDEFWA